MASRSGAYILAVNLGTGAWGISSHTPAQRATTRALYMACHEEYIEGMQLWSLAYPEASRIFFESEVCRLEHQTLVMLPLLLWPTGGEGAPAATT